MMQVIPLTWKIIGHNPGFPCFVRGCDRHAEYVVKIKKGDVVIQVCLCVKCLHDSPATILRNIGQNHGDLHLARTLEGRCHDRDQENTFPR